MVRIVAAVIGALAGALAAVIVELNLVIFSGIEDGYEATLPDLFAENASVGVLAVGILLAGPIAGGIAGYRFARRDRPIRPR